VPIEGLQRAGNRSHVIERIVEVYNRQAYQFNGHEIIHYVDILRLIFT